MVCVLGIDRGTQVLREHDAALEVPSMPFIRFVSGGFLRYMPPDRHKYYQRIFRSAFSPIVVQECRPFISETVRQELAQMAEFSRRTAGGVWPRPHLEDLVFAI